MGHVRLNRLCAAIFLAALTIAACGSNSTTTAPPDTEPVEAESPATTTTTAAPGALALDGASLYESNCSRCHRSDGSGRIGPNLLGVTLTGFVERVVRTGPGEMPAFPELTDAEVTAIASHVVDNL